MISFRHHIVSLVAVFLALAVGIALGGGPLSDLGRASDASSPTSSPSPAEGDPTGQRTADFGNAFALAGAARLYHHRLRHHDVAILELPGADPGIVASLTQQIAAAGGRVTGTFAATRALLAPGQKSLVDTLSSQLMTQLDDPRVSTTAPTYERMGQVLGLTVATGKARSATADSTALSLRQSLSGAQLLTSPSGARLAPLVLVALPQGGDNSDDAATRAILGGLVSGLAANAVGVVAVGDSESATNGDLAALRAADVTGSVATVDAVETSLGVVTGVLALVRTLDGTGGAFGPGGQDGVVPLR